MIGLACALVGAVYGICESVRYYPAGSWFGATLYVATLGCIAGMVLGTAVGALVQLVRTRSRRA